MTLPNHFSDLMTQSASYQNPSTRDLYGARTFATAVNFMCHITYSQKNMMKGDGTTVVIDGTLKMDGIYSIQQGAQIVFADSSTAEVITVRTYYDESGPHHTSVDFSGT